MNKRRGQVTATLTEYKFGNNVLDRISALGEEILAEPVILSTDGQPIRFDKWDFREVAEDRVRIHASGKSSLMVVQADYTIDYDGMILIDFHFIPVEGASVKDLTLNIPLKSQYAKLLHACTTWIRQHPAKYLDSGEGVVWDSLSGATNNFMPYIWFGDVKRGLCWFTEDSQRNWTATEDKPMCEIIRKDGKASLRLRILNGARKSNDEFTITMGLQATPVKPMMPQYHRQATAAVNGWVPEHSNAFAWLCSTWMWSCEMVHLKSNTAFSSGLKPWGGNYSFVEYLKSRDKDDKEEDIMRVVDKFINENAPAKLSAEDRRRSRSHMGHAAVKLTRETKHLLAYINPRATTMDWQEYRVFQDEWNSLQFRPDMAYAYISDPVPSFCDYIMSQLRELARHGMDGIYYDNTCLLPNFDETMGPAGECPPGVVQPHYSFMSMRNLVKRTATMLFLEGKLTGGRPFISLHITNANIVPIMSFASHQLDWEMRYGAENYQNRFDEGFILAESIGTQTGLVPSVLLDCNINTTHIQQTALAVGIPYGIIDYALGGRGPSAPMRFILNALHGFGFAKNDCLVWPCYDDENPVKSADQRVKVLTLKRSKSALIFAGNVGDGGKIDLDISKLGFSMPVVIDAENGADVTTGSKITGDIPYHKYRLLMVGDGRDEAVAGVKSITPSLEIK